MMKVHCLNCGTDYEGNFCPECGQKSDTKRLSLSSVFSLIAAVFTKRDNKTLRTCRELIMQPGIVAREFILGRRGRYNAPMPLLIALVALFSIAVHYMPDAASPINTVQIEVSSTVTSSTDGAEEEVKKIITLSDPEIFEYLDFDVIVLLAIQEILGNIVYRTILSSIFCALPFWLIFRRSRLQRPDGQLLSLNLAEHFFALFYLACISMMLAFICLPLNFVPGMTNRLNIILGIIPTLIGIYMYRQMLSLSWLRSIWLNLLASCLTITLIFLAAYLLYNVGRIEAFFTGANLEDSFEIDFDWNLIKSLLGF